MTSRRKFIKNAALSVVAVNAASLLQNCSAETSHEKSNEDIKALAKTNKPVVLSTWKFGMAANKKAWEVLMADGRALDAVEKGVNVTEADPNERSVGLGGRPDRDGIVTLDSCIMDEFSNIGSVAALEHIVHPSSVARAVMEKTPHVMIVGEGALRFALEQGFKKENLLTAESEKEWREWLKTANYKPVVNIENHDTIGMIALDKHGNLSGCCTTSGLAFKMHGRVGDSPIIGAGLYVDNEVGAATATGHGEEVIRVTGSFLVVELMRQGKSPQQACEEAVKRINKKFELRKKDSTDTQIGFIALNKKGEYGAYCLREGFSYALHTSEKEELVPANHLL
ncbi:MAG: isoaspartyl peptidase/L-asparaginase family protein [Flavobacteriales bacterium]